MRPNITHPGRLEGEEALEHSLRPKTLDEFIGQQQLKDNLRVFISAAKKRNEPIDHLLLYGPPGLGKTTLAHIVANELGTTIYSVSAPALEKPGDLVGLLTKLGPRDILFIDEIHRLNRVIEEYLYSAMEDYRISVVLDKGPNARAFNLRLAPFTLIGATTRSGLISSPLRSRFEFHLRVNFYPPEELCLIVKRSANLLNVEIDHDSAMEIAKRARGTPRIANRLLKRVRDFAEVIGEGKIDRKVTDYALEQLNVDPLGLNEVDREILLTIVKDYRGGPVGLSTIAVKVGETPDTIEEVFEPYLIQLGLIKRTRQGRVATPLAYQHLGLEPGRLF